MIYRPTSDFLNTFKKNNMQKDSDWIKRSKRESLDTNFAVFR